MFYKLSMDMDRPGDILAFCQDGLKISYLDMIVGEYYEGWDGSFFLL